METNGDAGYQVHDEVKAEHVTITQGGAAVVEADTVEVTQGGIQAAQANTLSISQGGAMIVETEVAELTMSGAGVLSADRVELTSAGAGIAIADTLVADDKSTIGFLFAGTIEGQPDVKIDARAAAAFGAGLAVALFLLSRIFGRR